MGVAGGGAGVVGEVAGGGSVLGGVEGAAGGGEGGAVGVGGGAVGVAGAGGGTGAGGGGGAGTVPQMIVPSPTRGEEPGARISTGRPTVKLCWGAPDSMLTWQPLPRRGT